MIIEETEKGTSLRKTAKKFGLASSTVHDIFHKYIFRNTVENFKTTGRTRLLLPADEKIMSDAVRKNPNVTSDHIREMIGSYMSTATIQRRLREIKEQIRYGNNKDCDIC